MATVRFRGDAPPIAQINTWAFGGTWEADDLIRVTFSTGRYYDFTAGSTATATVVGNLVTLWNVLVATVHPEWAELTASASTTTFILTSDTAGKAFACTLTPLEANATTADAQTIAGGTSAAAGTVATANSGPNSWSVAANWDGGSVPTDGDTVILENTNADILYGLAQSAVTLAELRIRASYTGKIGLPLFNTAGTTYYEYRATYLAIGATLLNIGEGTGNGSGRLKINVGSVQTAVTVFATASSAEPGLSALLWKGSHASNVMSILGGSVGVAQLGGETAVILTLLIEPFSTGATVYLGSGLTNTTTMTMTGGTVTYNAASASITVHGGALTVSSGAHPVLDVFGGTAIYNSTGTLGGMQVTIGTGGTLDLEHDVATKIIGTSINASRGANIWNKNGACTSYAIVAIGCRIEEVNQRTPYGRTATYS